MLKLLIKILLLLNILILPSISFAWENNINVSNTNKTSGIDNKKLNDLFENDKNFFSISDTWEKWIKNLLFNIARDVRIVIFTIVVLIWMIMVFRFLFSEQSEKSAWNFKKWFLWATIWLVVIQIPYSFYSVVFDKEVNVNLANSIQIKLIQPFLNLLMFLVSFVFISISIYAFFRIITAWWEEEKIKKWKTTIIQAIIWYIVIKVSETLVENTLVVWCSSWLWVTNNCEQKITQNSQVIFDIINWFNTFVALAIVLMVIYAWFLIVTSAWDEEKYKRAKWIMIYIWVWVLVLFASYLILTFFIVPESTIWS